MPAKNQFEDAVEVEALALEECMELEGISEFDSDEEYADEFTIDDEWDCSGGDFTKRYNRIKGQFLSMTQPMENNIAIKGQITTQLKQQKKEIEQKDSKINAINLFQLPVGKKADGGKYLTKDKADRATVEQVLDPRTRMILFKLINRGTILQVNGCISTGKEANVYHATTPEKTNLAIKIYKTSILVFKDRDRYVAGEYRFRHGYSKSNPRKMVQTWAEKEMRNLKRLSVAGIPCPEPIVLRLHVLVMTLVGGSSGWAAPRLKDAVVADQESYLSIYRQVIKILWKLYNKCKLVHADFSEYNLLYYKKVVYVIDVSQSVEHDHPHALEFLRKDVSNTIDYFRKKFDLQIMTVRELFDFVVTDLETLKNKIDLTDALSTLGIQQDSSVDSDDKVLDLYLDQVLLI